MWFLLDGARKGRCSCSTFGCGCLVALYDSCSSEAAQCPDCGSSSGEIHQQCEREGTVEIAFDNEPVLVAGVAFCKSTVPRTVLAPSSLPTKLMTREGLVLLKVCSDYTWTSEDAALPCGGGDQGDHSLRSCCGTMGSNACCMALQQVQRSCYVVNIPCQSLWGRPYEGTITGFGETVFGLGPKATKYKPAWKPCAWLGKDVPSDMDLISTDGQTIIRIKAIRKIASERDPELLLANNWRSNGFDWTQADPDEAEGGGSSSSSSSGSWWRGRSSSRSSFRWLFSFWSFGCWWCRGRTRSNRDASMGRRWFGTQLRHRRLQQNFWPRWGNMTWNDGTDDTFVRDARCRWRCGHSSKFPQTCFKQSSRKWRFEISKDGWWSHTNTKDESGKDWRQHQSDCWSWTLSQWRSNVWCWLGRCSWTSGWWGRLHSTADRRWRTTRSQCRQTQRLGWTSCTGRDWHALQDGGHSACLPQPWWGQQFQDSGHNTGVWLEIRQRQLDSKVQSGGQGI